jgi:predicted MFS family arabinose efflux permease
VPLAVVVIVLCHQVIPESRDPEAARHFDTAGVVLATVGLAGTTYALTEWGSNGGSLLTMLAAVVGVAALVGFVVAERRGHMPMVPLTLFTNRDFAVVNLVTLVVYAALSGCFFFLAVQLQVSGGYSPLAAGAATVPVSILMLLLSERAGALAGRLGARLMIGAGSLICALGLLLLAPIGRHPGFVLHVLPGIVVFGLGLCSLVAPLTGTVLAAAPDRYAGTASGINNAVSRAGGLLAVAALPLLIGLTGDEYADPSALTPAYRHAMYFCIGLLVLGAAAAFAGITRGAGRPSADIA